MNPPRVEEGAADSEEERATRIPCVETYQLEDGRNEIHENNEEDKADEGEENESENRIVGEQKGEAEKKKNSKARKQTLTKQ